MNAEELQRAYYEQTADAYDEMHVSEDGEHATALRYVGALLELTGCTTVLDVGCGTGRGVRYFLDHGMKAHGIEPVQALLDQAINKHAIPAEVVTQGSAYSLPFPDHSFDAVCEFGVLHHVAKPELAIREMTRVARKAVFLSDANRFGQGSQFARLLKLSLYRAHLWPLVNWIKTRGKGFIITSGDGLSYSYSIYDSFDILAAWADRVFIIPTRKEAATSWQHPLLTSGHGLLCAIRDQ